MANSEKIIFLQHEVTLSTVPHVRCEGSSLCFKPNACSIFSTAESIVKRCSLVVTTCAVPEQQFGSVGAGS